MISPYVFPGIFTLKNSASKMEVIKSICEYYNIKEDLVMSKRRNHNLVNCRHAICFTLNKLMQINLTEVGRTLGGRDHSTVINSCKVFLARIESSPHLYADYRKMIAKVNYQLRLEFDVKYRIKHKQLERLDDNVVKNVKPLPEDFALKVFLSE